MSDYGFEIRRSDGSVQLTTRETVARFVHIERIPRGFSGTFSVPEFDAVESGGVFTGRGFFYTQYVVRGQDDGAERPAYGAMIVPNLNWDNTNKIMTVSMPSIPGAWLFRTRPNYDIIFIHLR